jgi:hypothetical protein
MSENKIKASCTWGDGPDVVVSFQGTRVILYEDPTMKGWKHGYVENGSFDLTSGEATVLAHQLLNAAKGAKEMEKSLNDYMEHHKERERIRKQCQ